MAEITNPVTNPVVRGVAPHPVAGLAFHGARVDLPVTPHSPDEKGPVSAAFLRQLEHRRPSGPR